ncbi:AAA family ATPase [Fictibacillus sp. JL2B1089]|uniref:AAA family ATPase n=1 Tax=Fictibacillus sp. JL2B1089 TaxID=3399565 RepID=UPI003A89697B
MNIRFERLSVSNFKNHKSLTVEFKDINSISGRNGAGKSSIGEAITWCLYGVDSVGTKIDPTPIGEEVPENIAVDLLIAVDEVSILLTRSLVKGKAKYHINDVPKKAKEYEQLVEGLFNKNLFLSLFNPNYFSSQHWQEQRSQLLQYVSEPLNKEVLVAISKTGAKHLEPLLKKLSLDDIEASHKELFKKNDKLVERAAERVITLQEQLDKFLGVHDANQDPEQIKKQIDEIVAKRNTLDDERHKQRDLSIQRERKAAAIESLRDQIAQQKKFIDSLKAEPVKENCHTCGQPLTESSLQVVHESKRKRLAELVEDGKALVSQRKKLQAEFEELPTFSEVEIDREASFALDEQIYPLKAKLEAFKRIDQLKEEIEEAAATKETIRKERNKAQAVTEAVKEFRTKRAELMVQKMDELFTTINIRLFEELKNGELRATFEIEMDGKPYSKLSTAEKIKAGLEVIEVLSQQSDVIAPTFVDNAESILKFTKPSGQLLTATVKDCDFEISTKSIEDGGGNEK